MAFSQSTAQVNQKLTVLNSNSVINGNINYEEIGILNQSGQNLPPNPGAIKTETVIVSNSTVTGEVNVKQHAYVLERNFLDNKPDEKLNTAVKNPEKLANTLQNLLKIDSENKSHAIIHSSNNSIIDGQSTNHGDVNVFYNPIINLTPSPTSPASPGNAFNPEPIAQANLLADPPPPPINNIGRIRLFFNAYNIKRLLLLMGSIPLLFLVKKQVERFYSPAEEADDHTLDIGDTINFILDYFEQETPQNICKEIISENDYADSQESHYIKDLKSCMGNIQVNMDVNPNSKFVKLYQAQAMLRKKEFQKVKSICNSILTEDPNSEKALIIKAMAQIEVRENDEAIVTLNKVLAIFQSVYNDFASMLKAVALIKKAIKLKDSESEIFFVEAFNITNNFINDNIQKVKTDDPLLQWKMNCNYSLAFNYRGLILQLLAYRNIVPQIYTNIIGYTIDQDGKETGFIASFPQTIEQMLEYATDSQASAFLLSTKKQAAFKEFRHKLLSQAAYAATKKENEKVVEFCNRLFAVSKNYIDGNSVVAHLLRAQAYFALEQYEKSFADVSELLNNKLFKEYKEYEAVTPSFEELKKNLMIYQENKKQANEIEARISQFENILNVRITNGKNTVYDTAWAFSSIEIAREGLLSVDFFDPEEEYLIAIKEYVELMESSLFCFIKENQALASSKNFVNYAIFFSNAKGVCINYDNILPVENSMQQIRR